MPKFVQRWYWLLEQLFSQKTKLRPTEKLNNLFPSTSRIDTQPLCGWFNGWMRRVNCRHLTGFVVAEDLVVHKGFEANLHRPCVPWLVGFVCQVEGSVSLFCWLFASQLKVARREWSPSLLSCIRCHGKSVVVLNLIKVCIPSRFEVLSRFFVYFSPARTRARFPYNINIIYNLRYSEFLSSLLAYGINVYNFLRVSAIFPHILAAPF